MLEHIHRGDIYEANFCMEFYAKNAQIEPLEIYQKLNAISEPPFPKARAPGWTWSRCGAE